ncbi:hypothetical protein BaRGS_00002813, partial [Batillaria attramentaria]
ALQYSRLRQTTQHEMTGSETAGASHPSHLSSPLLFGTGAFVYAYAAATLVAHTARTTAATARNAIALPDARRPHKHQRLHTNKTVWPLLFDDGAVAEGMGVF